jgi:hypothetical protein
MLHPHILPADHTSVASGSYRIGLGCCRWGRATARSKAELVALLRGAHTYSKPQEDETGVQ